MILVSLNSFVIDVRDRFLFDFLGFTLTILYEIKNWRFVLNYQIVYKIRRIDTTNFK